MFLIGIKVYDSTKYRASHFYLGCSSAVVSVQSNVGKDPKQTYQIARTVRISIFD
jgi:hypothetical protein